MTIDDIDFAALYRQHMAQSQRRPKPPSAWDARAESLGRKPLGGVYAETFISRMDLTDSRSLLDVGCGPGSIGLLLAGRLEEVIGMDYSPRMLEQFADNALRLGLDNATPLLRAWEDSWHDVPCCDVVVASRSGMVLDLQDALAKLNAHARQRVYMTQLVGGHFLDAELTSLLGRRRASAPDYIYTVNLLHAQGIHPRLSYIEVPSRLAGTRDFDEFAQRVAWSLGELSAVETARLEAWYHTDPRRAAAGGAPMRWALIDWDAP